MKTRPSRRQRSASYGNRGALATWTSALASGCGPTCSPGTARSTSSRSAITRCWSTRCRSPDRYRESAERGVLADYRWWSLAEIEASDAVFVRRQLGLLLPRVRAGDYPAEPLAVGCSL